MNASSTHGRLVAVVDDFFDYASQPGDHAAEDTLRRLGFGDGRFAVYRLVLDASAALTSVLDIHRYGRRCAECGTPGLCPTLRALSDVLLPVEDDDPLGVTTAVGNVNATKRVPAHAPSSPGEKR